MPRCGIDIAVPKGRFMSLESRLLRPIDFSHELTFPVPRMSTRTQTATLVWRRPLSSTEAQTAHPATVLVPVQGLTLVQTTTLTTMTIQSVATPFSAGYFQETSTTIPDHPPSPPAIDGHKIFSCSEHSHAHSDGIIVPMYTITTSVSQ